MPTATSIQSIPQINLSSSLTTSEPGKFDNAYIKTLNIDIGVTDNPTSINVGLINEVGNYRNYPLSYTDAYNLKIGNDLSIWCYLVSQKKSTSSSSKTTEVEFIDGSHILDRVFIGGIGVHTLDERYWTFAAKRAEIPVTCPPCHTDNVISIPDPSATVVRTASSTLPLKSGQVYVNPIYTDRLLRNSTLEFSGNIRDGGYIFLGNEKYTKTSCDLAQVDYSFHELRLACDKMGITIAIPDKSMTPLGYSTLRKAHWGTLRSVLKSWCADFGTSFVYDYTSLAPVIREVQLRAPVLSSSIKVIANTAKIIKLGHTSLVEQVSEDKTLKGSFKNTLVTSYKKPKSKRDFEKNTFYGTAYKCFQTSDVLGEEARSYRTGFQYNQCCSLAKYNQNMRTLYLAWLAGTRWNSGAGDGKMYRALGFNAVRSLKKDLQDEIIDECLDTETYREVTSKFLSTGVTEFDMILGTFSEGAASRHAEFEKNFAEEFLGKWFFTNFDSYADEKYGGYKLCYTGADWRYEISSSMTPPNLDVPTSSHSMNGESLQARLFNQAKLPFAKNLWGPIPDNRSPWNYYDWFSDPRIKIYNRTDAPWNIPQESAEAVFTSETDDGMIDLATPFLPRFQKIEGLIETRLRARFGGTNVPIGRTIDGVKEKSIPCLLIAPKPARIGEILNVSSYFPAINPNETPYFFNKGTSMGNTLDCSSSLKCELQGGLEQEVCKPKNFCAGYPQLPPGSVTANTGIGKIYGARDSEPFQEGVLNFLGGGFTVSWRPPVSKGKASGPERGPLLIVGPAGTAGSGINDIYLANYKEHVKSTYYTPKIEQIRGGESYSLTNAGNVSEVRVTLNDVSSNEPIFSAKNALTGQTAVITKIYIHGLGFLTLEAYHAFVKSFTDQGNLDPVKHSVDVTFGNVDFGPLAAYLSPSYGLNKLTCSIDERGISASAGWTNRPATPPSQDLFTKEIVPQIVAQRNLF
jgi:hypothetical protein